MSLRLKFVILSILTFTNIHIFSQRSLEDINSEDDLKQYILVNAPSEDAFVALQMLSKKYIDAENWDKAIDLFQSYKARFSNKRAIIEKLIELISSPGQDLTPINLGKSVNTENEEYFPVITIDSKYLYFTGANRSDGYGGEDIFVTEQVNGLWRNTKNLGLPFSTKGDDAVNSISADGNTLVIFGTYNKAIGGGDNFYAEMSLTGWSEIKPFPKPLNTIYWDCDGFLTADGNAFIFTSDRKGNIGEFHKGGIFFHGYYEGNTDIYVSVRNDSGWSDPINIGPVINTPYTERSPFLHPDGKTMYFSSDGHYGLGGLDVFKVEKLSESWTDWSEPVNLGKEINTSGFDVAYKISTDGKYAYFSSNMEGGYGGYDLYYIALPEEVKPGNVLTIKGKVTDENGLPLEADLRWSDVNVNKLIGQLRSNPATGEYMITLPVGSKYSYFADKRGYYSTSNEIDLSSETEHKVLNIDIKLLSVSSLQESGQTLVVNNIYFDFDKADLRSESFNELDRLFNFLANNPSIRVELSAHTDNQGSDEYNMNLSGRRAQSVIDYLISKGINMNRLQAKGYGESSPIADNSTEEGRARNRRVELKIIK